jgi:8-oxo-dGTP pyrophosphatase MutT (NUDIX family)
MQRSSHEKGSAPPSSLVEKHQVVAGFVIFRRTSDGIKFLLLYKRGNYWNFPKGHFEEGETSFTTALRETEEETGIRRSELHIVPNFRAYERFTFRSGRERVHDKVILFLAETRKADVRIAPREHSGFAWFLYEDAVRIIPKKYEVTKRVLKQAYDFIRKGGLRGGRPHQAGAHSHVSRSGAPGGQPTGVPSGR